MLRIVKDVMVPIQTRRTRYRLQPGVPRGTLNDGARSVIATLSYKTGELTAYQVQELLGFQTRMEVDGFLKAHGVPGELGLEDLEAQRASFDASANDHRL